MNHSTIAVPSLEQVAQAVEEIASKGRKQLNGKIVEHLDPFGHGHAAHKEDQGKKPTCKSADRPHGGRGRTNARSKYDIKSNLGCSIADQESPGKFRATPEQFSLEYCLRPASALLSQRSVVVWQR